MDIITIFAALIIFAYISRLLGLISALFQYPGEFINNYYVSLTYQVVVGIIFTILQVYLLCSIPAYCLSDNWYDHSITTLLALGIIIFCQLPNNETRAELYGDPLGMTVYRINVCLRLIATIPMYITLFSVPELIWEFPCKLIVGTTEWALNLPLIGFVIKGALGFAILYFLIIGIVFIAKLLQKLFQAL